MNYYMVEEKKLKELIESQLKLAALESGGVDNWAWYGESLYDFIVNYISENHICEDNEGFDCDFDYKDMAELELSHYVKVIL